MHCLYFEMHEFPLALLSSVLSSFKRHHYNFISRLGDTMELTKPAKHLLYCINLILCLELHFLATAHSLDEPVKLLFNVRAAKICGPGVADGELMELQHVHDSDLSHCAAKQLRTLVHAGRCGRGQSVCRLLACVISKQQQRTYLQADHH